MYAPLIYSVLPFFSLAKDHVLLLTQDHNLLEYILNKETEEYVAENLLQTISNVFAIGTGANHAIILKGFAHSQYYWLLTRLLSQISIF